MWIWAAIITVLSLVASYFIAIVWQHWTAKRRN